MQVNGAGNLYINPEFVRTLFNADMDGVVYNKDIEELNAAKGEAESYTVLSPGDKMFIGIIVHELWHIYKDHIIRMGDKTKMVSFGGMTCTLWNIATDLEINDILLHKWGYYLLKGCITPEPNGDWEMNGTTINVRGRSPERIYYELEKLLPPPPPKEDPRDIKAGDIIFDKKTGKYGEVVTITNGKARIAELTEQEAKSRV